MKRIQKVHCKLSPTGEHNYQDPEGKDVMDTTAHPECIYCHYNPMQSLKAFLAYSSIVVLFLLVIYFKWVK